MTEDMEPLEPIPIDPDDMPEPLPIEEEPLTLAEDTGTAGRKIQAFGAGAHAAGVAGVAYKRPLNLTGAGATRCKIFHSKVAVGSMEYMQNQINEWLDSEEIEVKHVTEVVGVLEGKNPEPNLIVMVWY